MKRITLIILVATLCHSHTTLAQTSRDNLKIQLRAYTDAFIQRDFEGLVKSMPPKMVEVLGGPERAVAFHQQIFDSLERQNLTFKTITLGEPTQIVVERAESFAIIPTTLQLSNKGEPAIMNDYLAAISSDGGAHWAFLAGSDAVAGILRSYPKVAYALTIPTRSLVLNSDAAADARLEFTNQSGKWVPTRETNQKLQRLLQNAR